MKYLSILNSTLDGVIVTSQSGIIEFCNDAAYSMLGYFSKELEGLAVEVLLPEAFRHAHVAHRSDYMDMPQQRIMNQNQRFTAIRKDGTEFPIAISLNPTRIEGEVYICASIQDLTQVEEEALKFEQAQKFEALGEMVSGIAHNFNNVLAGISGQAYLLSKSESLSEKDAGRIDSINSLSYQASDIIKQLLVYARNQNVEFENFKLGDITREIVQMAKITAPEKISIQFNESKNDLLIHGMKSQIQQTFLNIINNAIQAIGTSEGSINISTANCAGLNCMLRQCSLNRDDASSFVCIKIRDTGKGVARKHINRIFDPFFSTKPQGQGTGLGLSTSYGIINKHGGEISVSSIEGEGAMFQIFLPVAEKSKESRGQPAIMNPAIACRDTSILIIDDEPSIRNLIAEVLTGFGYSTFTASDGKEGVELFERKQDEIELVISDVAMPKLNGHEVMSKIRSIKSDVPFLIITGYPDSSVDESKLGDKTQVMLKPFDYVELSHKVWNLLDSPL
ncbi:MAG: ATP-binding protein [Mariprofundaceae bacterium]